MFTLQDQDGRNVSLADLRGKWLVLYFYPKDDTPGCTCQATEFTKLLQQFKSMNAAVVGISADPPEHHRIFIRKYKLALTLLSDPEHKVMEQYGAWTKTLFGDRTMGRVTRSSFIIDPQGIVRYHCAEVIPLGHAERLRRKLVELQKAG
jgi:peroxiredoxin Q/BCP